MKTAIVPALPPLLLLALLLVEVATGPSPEERARQAAAAVAPALTFQDLDSALLPESEGDPVDYPAWLVALDGKPVSIAGFMAPFDQLDDLTVFMLMPSYVGCYFCAPPSFTQVLLVRQREDSRRRKRPFIDPPIRVTGTLRLYHPESSHPAHRDQFVYALDDATFEILGSGDSLKRAPGHGGASPLLARAKGDQPAQDPNQPHAAFQPQLLLPGVTALRNLPLRQSMRFVKAQPGEIARRLRMELEKELPPAQQDVIGRALAQLGWLPAGGDWLAATARHFAERRAGLVDSKGGRVIYHEDLPLSKPAGRLAIAALIHEALLRQNHPAPFEEAASADAWLARRALREGDSAVLKADYTRRNWLSAPDPLPPLPWPPESATLTPPMRQWLDLAAQAGEHLIRRQRGRDSDTLLDSLYQDPPASFAYYWLPEWIHQQAAPLPPPPLPVEGTVLAETRLGAAALLVWLGGGLDTAGARPLLSRMITDRAAFLKPPGNSRAQFVWETIWSDESDAKEFAKLAGQAAARQALPPGLNRMQVHQHGGHPLSVVLQTTATTPEPLSLDTTASKP
jgi:hypothetical protein